MIEFAILIITCLFLKVVINRDKKYRKQYLKELKQYNKNIKAEQKRRIREEQLKEVRINHPKVIYLSDFRQKVATEPRPSNIG